VDAGDARERLLADKVSRSEERDSRLLAFFGEDGQLRAAIIQVEDRIRGSALGEKDVAALHTDCFVRDATCGEESGRIELGRFGAGHRVVSLAVRLSADVERVDS
jgi:hypothetical protein